MPPSRLVDDLIPLILELNDEHWWLCDLQRLALVSPAWVGPVRRRLYGCPAVHSFSSCNLLARALTESPHIRIIVRGVDLRPVFNRPKYASLTGKDTASLRFLLNLKGLQSVTLGGELAVHAERFLHMMSNTRTMIFLHIDGSHMQNCVMLHDQRQPASLEWDEVLAFKFSRLRHLHLSNLALSIAQPSLPYSLRIEQLILNGVVIVDGLLEHFCHESWQSMRKLSITAKQALDSDSQLRRTLQLCEHLESFAYEIRGSQGPSTVLEQDLPPLPTLRSLGLNHVDVTLQSLTTISQACEHLEELSITGRCVRITPEQWIDFVRSASLPSLRVLSTSSGTNIPPFTFWTKETKEKVLDVCLSRKINLV